MREVKTGWAVWSVDSEHVYTQRRISRAEAWNRRSLWAFAKWLASARGLSPGSITARIGSASTFVDAMTSRMGCSCARAFRLISAREIEEFFVAFGKDHGSGAVRSMQAAMRLFLRFASWRGWVDRELVTAVPSLRSYRLSGLPRCVSDAELSKLLESPWKGGDCPLRDRAVVCLLATYGVRRGQVSALRLTDIDWREKTIGFAAHKGGKAVRHVLTDVVAQALAQYLREERPTIECEYVVLRHRSPHVRLNPSAISIMVRTWMVRCGLPPLYPHAFRHAFASRLLRAGQPVKTIADLLGHHSLEAVSIYAKVDHPRLLEVAVEWPEATP